VIVVDTTVLVYAVGDRHQFREPCRRLVEAVHDGGLEATTTVEVIQEFAHVRARRRGRQDAVELARAYAELLSPLLIVEERDLIEGMRLFERHSQLGSFDAVLAAAALGIGATALVSADAAYGAVTRLNHVVPDEPGVAELARGAT
jgi:predicted nucleic acid-binding protein